MFNMEIVRVRETTPRVKPRLSPAFRTKRRRLWEHPRFWLWVRVGVFVLVLLALLLLFPREAW